MLSSSHRSCRLFDNNLDCWPSGRFWVGFIVPADAQATMILASLSSLASTPATLMSGKQINHSDACRNGSQKALISFQLHTSNKLRILFRAREDTKESKTKTTSYVPCRPFLNQSVHLHIDSSRRMTLWDPKTHHMKSTRRDQKSTWINWSHSPPCTQPLA